jgi:arylsulfatase A-like enzyme
LPSHEANLTTGNVDAPPVLEWGERVTPTAYEAGDPYEYDDPQECYADYYASITAVDDQLGRLVDALNEQGLAEDTLLAYTSDHGDMLYSHGNNQKGTPYEEAIRVPFIVRWPGEIPAGTTNETLIGTHDIAPTLLRLANIPVPDAMEGSDLSENLRDTTRAGPRSVILYGENWRGVRTDRYTYACVPTDHPDLEHLSKGHALLFDNKDDPYQRTNLIYDPEYRDVRDRLRAHLNEHLEHTGDPHLPLVEQVEYLGRGDDWERRQRYVAGELDA